MNISCNNTGAFNKVAYELKYKNYLVWFSFRISSSTPTHSSPSIIRTIKSRMMKWAGHVVRMGKKRNTHSMLVRKPEGRRPLGRPGHRWVDNIKMNFGEIWWGGVAWIDLAQDMDKWRALLNVVKNLRFP
jgi:hypothetical protein